ncbi:MAG: tetratricopeptide repeat protein [Ignavibacteriales bacterium]|nr:tetratricopeptide repeat protein [Ignavibacteriales bacterium]
MSARSDRVRVIEQAEKYVRAGRVQRRHRRVREARARPIPRTSGTLNIIGDLYIRRRPERPGRPLLPEGRRGIRAAGPLLPGPGHLQEDPQARAPTTRTTPSSSATSTPSRASPADAKTVYVAVAGRLVERREGRRGHRHLREDRQARPRGPSKRGRPWPACTGQTGNLDAALDQLNESAEVHAEKGQFDAAAAVLREALALRPGDVTQPGRPGRGPQEAEPARQGRRASSRRSSAGAPDNVQFLNILGNIHFEAGDTKQAEEIFTRIVTGHPLNVNARIKLGRIQILKDKLDQAYELFEPLINNLVKKHRDEKAIGLLGPHPGEPEAPPARPRTAWP